MKVWQFSLALALLPLLAGASSAQTFTVFLSGPNESPANASPGIGTATVIFDTALHTMSINTSFSGLLGTTTAAHIHAATAAPGVGTAGVATQTPTFAGFPLGVTSGTYANTFDMTLASSFNAAFIGANGGTPATAEAALVNAAQAGRSYLNIHTSVFPGGEIRGFLAQAAPEPGAGLLVVLGIGALACRRKRGSFSTSAA